MLPMTTRALRPPCPDCQGPGSRLTPSCPHVPDQLTCSSSPLLHGLPLPSRREVGLTRNVFVTHLGTAAAYLAIHVTMMFL